MENHWSNLLPKRETSAMKWLENNPTWDGRGVVVGILDTGVDPGAIGLSKTSDGKQKIIDIVDCTGSNDIVLGPEILLTGSMNFEIDGKLGRKIKVNSLWENPKNIYRVGVVKAFDFLPKALVQRITDERKEKFLEVNKQVEYKLRSDLLQCTTDKERDDFKTRIATLTAMIKDYEDPGPIYDCVVFHDGENYQAAIDFSEIGDMSNVKTMTDYRKFFQYSQIADFSMNYCVNINDNGTVLSVVTDVGAHGTHVAGIVSAYHPESIDENGVAPGAQIVSLKIGDARLGSMETGPGLMRALIYAVKSGCHIINMSYGEATKYDNYGEFIRLATEIVKEHGIIFVSSAGNNGPALSTLGCPGGTSSCCIGVGAMFTEGLMRVAYSFGDMDVQSSNYTWSSVGPCIDGDLGISITAPGGAITCVPTWTLTKKQLMNGTSMSSPNATGCISLVLSAMLDNKIRITSLYMKRIIENSAVTVPHIETFAQGFGCINVINAWDLVLKYHTASGVDSDSITDTKSLVTDSDVALWVNIPFSVNIVNDNRFSRGIYLRQEYETSFIQTFKVEIMPYFSKKISNTFKFKFEIKLLLTCSCDWIEVNEKAVLFSSGKVINVIVDPTKLKPDSVNFEKIEIYDENHRELGPLAIIPVTVTKPFVVTNHITELSLVNNKQSLDIIDGTSTSDNILMNTKSSSLDTSRNNGIRFSPGQTVRHFISPPRGCSYIDVVFKDTRSSSSTSVFTLSDQYTNVSDVGTYKDNSVVTSYDMSVSNPNDTVDTGFEASTSILVFHATQLMSGKSYREDEKEAYIGLRPGSIHRLSWSVVESQTVEICLARSWSTMSITTCDVTLYFYGVVTIPSQISMSTGSHQSQLVQVSSVLKNGDVEINPICKLDHVIYSLKPVNNQKGYKLGIVCSSSDRDELPDLSRIYQLNLEYEYYHEVSSNITDTLNSSGSTSLNASNNVISVKCGGLNGTLYESNFISQFYSIYIKNSKKCIGYGDAYPSTHKLPKKGVYTIVFQLKHRDPSILEKFIPDGNNSGLIIQVFKKLNNSINLSTYRRQSDVLHDNNNTFKSCTLIRDQVVGFYIKEPALSDFAGLNLKSGDILTGKLSLLKTAYTSAVNTGNGDPYHRPSNYMITYSYTGNSSVSSSISANSVHNTADGNDLNQVIKRAKISYLKSLTGLDSFVNVFSQILSEYKVLAHATIDDDYLDLNEILISHATKSRQNLFDIAFRSSSKHLTSFLHKDNSINKFKLEDTVKESVGSSVLSCSQSIYDELVKNEMSVNAASSVLETAIHSSSHVIDFIIQSTKDKVQTVSVDTPPSLLDATANIDPSDESSPRTNGLLEIAAEFGQILDKNDKEAAKRRKLMEKRKCLLISALALKSRSLLDLIYLNSLPDAVQDVSSDIASSNPVNSDASMSTASVSDLIVRALDTEAAEAKEVSNDVIDETNVTSKSIESLNDDSAADIKGLKTDLEATLTELRKWEDLSQDRYWSLYLYQLKTEGKYGEALKKVNTVINNNSMSSIPAIDKTALMQEQLFLLGQLRWDHVSKVCRDTFIADAIAEYKIV